MRFAPVVVASLAGSLALTAFGADPPDGDAAAVIAVDAVGQPSSYGRGVKQATYYLWHEDGIWHLRTKTKEKRRPFDGVIRVHGGTVTKLTELGGLETRKKKKARDRGFLSRDRRQIRFQMLTNGGEDGFDFQVSPGATQVSFELLVMGLPHPERIVIGANNAPAPNARFTLPAQPDADEPGQAGEKP